MKLALLVVLVLAALAPATALACDSCVAASSSAVQWAFIDGSVFLSVTPLLIVGGFASWLVRRARRMAAEEETGVIHLPPTSTRASRRP
jgi:ABC-type nickel/cobalt efflux system permease component RcnA